MARPSLKMLFWEKPRVPRPRGHGRDIVRMSLHGKGKNKTKQDSHQELHGDHEGSQDLEGSGAP